MQELPALRFISAEDGKTSFAFEGVFFETRSDGSATLWLGVARAVSCCRFCCCRCLSLRQAGCCCGPS